jgi:hypothetical protein
MMDWLLREVEDFAKVMTGKGYDQAFLTNGGFPGSLKQSIDHYLYAVVMGSENGISNGFQLFTYLKWEGEGKENVEADFKIIVANGGLKVSSMTTTLMDGYGNSLNAKTDQVWLPSHVPTKLEAIAMLYREKQQRVKKKNRLKF